MPKNLNFSSKGFYIFFVPRCFLLTQKRGSYEPKGGKILFLVDTCYITTEISKNVKLLIAFSWSSRNDFSASERWREINGYADYLHRRYDSDEKPTATTMEEPTKSTAPIFSDYELAEMGRKRMEIFVHLTLDPTISVKYIFALKFRLK